MSEARLTLDMTTMQAALAVSGDNPSAISVCGMLIKEAAQIDPDALAGNAGVAMIMNLDEFDIYEHRIWMLYKDVCGESIRDMMAVLRGRQLGIVGDDALQHAIDNRGDMLDVPKILAAVQEELPAFGREPEPAEGA